MDYQVDGKRVAELRQQHGWGQRDLAEAGQIDPSVVSRLERNLQDDCMLSIVVAIASALGVTVDELLMQGQHATYLGLTPELQSATNQLAHQSPAIQRQAAGILRGYLSTLENLPD